MSGQEKGLSTLEIDQVLRWDPVLAQHCLSTRAENTIPTRVTHFPRAFVTNTSPNTKPGAHWVAFLFWDAERAEFFDSYGMPGAFYSPRFERLLQQFRQVKHNDRDLQSLQTHVCGQWCLFWLYHRLRGISQEDTFKDFQEERELRNDQVVAHFVLTVMVQPYRGKVRRAEKKTNLHQWSHSRVKQAFEKQ